MTKPYKKINFKKSFAQIGVYALLEKSCGVPSLKCVCFPGKKTAVNGLVEQSADDIDGQAGSGAGAGAGSEQLGIFGGAYVGIDGCWYCCWGCWYCG